MRIYIDMYIYIYTHYIYTHMDVNLKHFRTSQNHYSIVLSRTMFPASHRFLEFCSPSLKGPA